MSAIVSTRIIALEALSPRTDTSPVIEPLDVAPVEGAAFQGGQTDFDTGVGFFLGYSGGAYKLSIGDPAGANLTWTAADGLNVSGTVTATAGTIGGWTINSAYLAKDTGVDATSAGMAPDDYPFFAGATYANRAAATFRVTPAGNVIGANFATATSGKRIDIGATAPNELQFYGDTGGGVEAAATIGLRAIGPDTYILIVGTGSATNTKNAIIARAYDGEAVRGQTWGAGVGVYGISNSGYGGYFSTTSGSAGVAGYNSGAGAGVSGQSVSGIAGVFTGNISAAAVRITSGAGQHALDLQGAGTMLMAGLLTCSALTASVPVIANASKQIVSATQTGTGTVFAMQTSPAFATDISTPAIKTASGALTITPAAGSGLNVALSTTGDFAVNTNQLVVDTSTGAVTMAAQPAFLARNSATDTNVTGNGTAATVDYDTEIFDQGSNFATDTFTASVTGRHRFSAMVDGMELGGATVIDIRLVTSNRTYVLFYRNAAALIAGAEMILGGGTLADMDAGDTSNVTYKVSGIGADTADIYGGAQTNTYFSGELVC